MTKLASEWVDKGLSPQEKLKTMLMQKFWRDNKEYYGTFKKGL